MLSFEIWPHCEADCAGTGARALLIAMFEHPEYAFDLINKRIYPYLLVKSCYPPPSSL